MNIENILRVAEIVRTPLILSGLALIVAFLLFRSIIQRGSKTLQALIIKFVFILALLSFILGFVGYCLPFLENLFIKNENICIYGRVYIAGNRSIPVEKVNVCLELETTLKTRTNNKGEFRFEFARRHIGKKVNFWVEGNSEYEPPLPDSTYIEETMDKIQIGLRRLKPISPQNKVTFENIDSTFALSSFYFFYGFPPNPGKRKWTRVSSSQWIEAYENGQYKRFITIGRTRIDDCYGTILRDENDSTLDVFVPERNCSLLWIRFRKNGGQWDFLGEMHGVK